MTDTQSLIKSREEAQYEEAFEAMVRHLEERRRTDRHFSPEVMRRYLKDAYFWQECDWLGNGAVFDTNVAAIIAAHEHVLAEWEAEEKE